MRLEKGMILPLQFVLPDIGALEAVELCEPLGRGAFGHVWKVRPIDSADTEKTWLGFVRPRKKKGVAANTEDYYVLKYIKAESGSHAERVRREANAGAKIASKHVVCCYGCQELGANQFVLLFPYERGKNLAEWLAANPQASWLKKRQIFLDILDGVRALHHAGIIHRDLKPENIFVTLPYHDPRIIDFGLAKFRDLERMTPSGREPIGTLLYIPPEARWHAEGWDFVGSEKADERYDLYALGIILYQMVIGYHPRHARLPHISSSNILQAKHLLEISAFEFADDPRVAEAIRVCTMTDPNARLRRVDDLIAILDGYAEKSAPVRPECVEGRTDLSQTRPSTGSGRTETTPSNIISFRNREAKKPTPTPSQEGRKTEQPTPKKNAAVTLPSSDGKREQLPSSEGVGVGSTWTEPTTGMIFMYIPAGRFMMGSPDSEEGRSSDEGPVREVRFAQGFWMGKYPVTQAEWQTIMGENPSRFKGERRPVENVSWNDAQAFLKNFRSLGDFGNLTPRLPTEAEWEYACRAGTTTPFYFGETISADQANYNGKYVYGKGKQGVYREQTTDVGSFPPNAWGLCDMHGNIWEWCEDAWHSNYNGAPNDGRAWLVSGGSYRVLRGGSWDNEPRNVRSAYRNGCDPALRGDFVGFRVARTI